MHSFRRHDQEKIEEKLHHGCPYRAGCGQAIRVAKLRVAIDKQTMFMSHVEAGTRVTVYSSLVYPLLLLC